MSLPLCSFTEIPRLLCGCKIHHNWMFDYDDLDQAEHDYLHGLVEVESRRDPYMTVVSLPEYTTRSEYTQAQIDAKIAETEEREAAGGNGVPLNQTSWPTVPTPKMDTTGDPCPNHDEHLVGKSYVCARCISELHRQLLDVPELLVELAVQERKQSTTNRQHGGGRTERVNQPLPYGVGASLARNGLRVALTDAAKQVTGATDVPVTVGPLSMWLIGHLSDLAKKPSIVEIVRNVDRAHARAMESIDNAEDSKYIGLCACGTPLHARAGSPTHRCPRCGADHDVAERIKANRDRVRDSLLTINEAVRISMEDKTLFGRRLHKKQLQRWVAQGLLLQMGTKPAAGPRGEAALYWAAGILDLATRRGKSSRVA